MTAKILATMLNVASLTTCCRRLAAAFFVIALFGVVASAQSLTDSLPNGAKLPAGSSLKSPNGRFVLTQQTDGNTCLYDGSKMFWCNMVNGKGAAYLVMQADDNLCAYTAADAYVWCNMVHDYPDMQTAVLRVQDDGNLVVYTGTTPRWATNTVQR